MQAKILYVDDDLDTGRSRLEHLGFNFIQKKPHEIDSNILRDSRGIKLILMDYDLNENSTINGIYTPYDGIEFLERFRALLRSPEFDEYKVPLLTIYSGKYNKLVSELDCPSSPHLVAQSANVDWIFQKGLTNERTKITKKRLDAIFSAYDFDLTSNESDKENILYKSLKLKENLPWSEMAKEHLSDSQPPLKMLGTKTAHANLIRWLLQIALPNPGCFVKLASIAVRLHLSPKNLSEALSKQPAAEFFRKLKERKYKGLLAGFFSDRYWKAGIDQLIWELTKGRSPKIPEVSKLLFNQLGGEVPILEEDFPILLSCPDNYELTEHVTDIEKAVQIQPHKWPAGVELPWVRISEVLNDRELRALVIGSDRYRIS